MSDCRRCGRDAGLDAFACNHCADVARADLTTIADFANHLDDKRARIGSNWQNGTIGRAAETPMPFDPRVSKVADPIRVALHGTARIVIDAGAVILPLSDDIHDVAEWLVTRCDWLRRQECGPTEFDTFDVCRSNIVALFDRPPERMYVGRCQAEVEGGNCTESLYVETDDHGKPSTEYTHCPKCDESYKISERQEEIKAGVKNYLGTMKEISHLCRLTHSENVSMSMLYTYVANGLIHPHGTRIECDSAGRHKSVPTYRIGDIDVAIEDWRQLREQRRHAGKKSQRVA